MRIIRSLEEGTSICEDAAKLGSHPEQNWELYCSTIRYRKPPVDCYIVALLESGRLQAALLGRVEAGHVDLKLGYWDAVHMPVRRIVIPMSALLGHAEDDALRAMVERVVRDLRDCAANLAVFEYLEDDSALRRAAKSASVGFWMRDRVPERQIHHYLKLPATFNEYNRQHKGLLQKVRKFEKAFEGRYDHRWLTREDEIDAFCEGADALVSKTYLRALGAGFLNSEADHEKIRAAARQGAWRAFVTLVDGKIIAFWCGCSFGSSAFFWWTAYDTNYREFSPGLVASTRMVERLIGDGVRTIDFGGGDAAYKERLGNDSRWEESVWIYAPGLKGAMANGLHGLNAAIGNLSRTKLKGFANRMKTPWRRLMALKMLHAENPPRAKQSHGAPSERTDPPHAAAPTKGSWR